MNEKRHTPPDPAKDSSDRPDVHPNVIDDVLTGPSLDNVPVERDRSVIRQSGPCEDEGLGTAIRRRFAPYGGVKIPEYPDVPMREPPDFSGPEFDWPDTEEGRKAFAERRRRFFRREDDDA